jgi:glycosyltransferase involved in cell wall biosynthesis
MKEADIFAQHSMVDPDTGDEEGLPVTILEAMAEGLPVVATRHAGIPEEVIEGETGILVDETDVEAMAAGLVELARSPERRQEFGYNGWKRVRTRFSAEYECEKLRELLGLTECGA